MGLRLGQTTGGTANPVGRRPRADQRLDALRVALFILIVLDVSRINAHFPILAAVRAMQLLVGFTLVYVFLHPRLVGTFRSWSRTWPARVVAALGVAACLSALFGISLGRAAKFILEDYVKVLALAFLIMSSIRNARDLALYAWAYVAACAVLVWMSWFVFGLEVAKSGGIARLEALYTYDANDVCAVLLIGLGLCRFTYQVSGRLGKMASAVVMIGIGLTLARTGSRGGFVGLAGLTAAFLFAPATVSFAKRAVFVGAIGLSLAMGSSAGYWRQMGTVLAPEEDYNWTAYYGRKMVAKRGLGYMRSYPLFGVGINSFPLAEGTLSQVAKDWTPSVRGVYWSAPHNSYIQVGAEMGFPAVVLWSSLLIGGVVSCWRLRRRMLARWARGDAEQRLLFAFAESLPLALVGFGVTAAFVSFAYLDPIYILAAYVTGMHVAVEDRRRWDSAPKRPESREGLASAAQAPSVSATVRPVRRGRSGW